jgi:hypothetical protein
MQFFIVIFSSFSGHDPSIFFFSLKFKIIFKNYLVLSLSWKSGIGNNSLDLGSFLSFLAGFRGKSSSHNRLFDQSNIISLFEGKKLSDFVGSFRTQASGHVLISKPGNFVISLLWNWQRQDLNVVANNASSNWFTSSLSSSTGSIALVILI